MVQLDWGYGISRCEVVEEVKAKQLSGGPEVFSIKIYLPVPVPTSPSLSSSIITSVHFISSSHHFHQNIPVNKHTIHHVQLRQWQGLHLRRVNRLGMYCAGAPEEGFLTAQARQIHFA